MAQLSYLFIYIPLGILPSLIWLLFYLRKDSHPESNRMILKIFFWGAAIAILAIFIEIALNKGFEFLGPSISKTTNDYWGPILVSILSFFVGVALVEEFLKYLVVKKKVFNSSEFDEPLDAMLYMIIAALGFAAMENILYIVPSSLNEVFAVILVRFLGATFLHALLSAIIGYFAIISFLENKKGIFNSGFMLAVLLHGLYNFSIITITSGAKFIVPLIIIISCVIFVSFAFKKAKKMNGVCKIKN